MPLKIAITLGTLNPKSWLQAALTAEALGLDAVFISDHVVFPERMEGTLHGASVPATTPLVDSLAYLCFLAGVTRRIRLGTFGRIDDRSDLERWVCAGVHRLA